MRVNITKQPRMPFIWIIGTITQSVFFLPILYEIHELTSILYRPKQRKQDCRNLQ